MRIAPATFFLVVKNWSSILHTSNFVLPIYQTAHEEVTSHYAPVWSCRVPEAEWKLMMTAQGVQTAHMY